MKDKYQASKDELLLVLAIASYCEHCGYDKVPARILKLLNDNEKLTFINARTLWVFCKEQGLEIPATVEKVVFTRLEEEDDKYKEAESKRISANDLEKKFVKRLRDFLSRTGPINEIRKKNPGMSIEGACERHATEQKRSMRAVEKEYYREFKKIGLKPSKI